MIQFRPLAHAPRALALLAITASAPRVLAAQTNRVFNNAPAASWIAPPNVPGDSFVVFHARRGFGPPSVAHVAFENPDGSRVVVLTNGGSSAAGLRVALGDAELSLPGDSVTTLAWT